MTVHACDEVGELLLFAAQGGHGVGEFLLQLLACLVRQARLAGKMMGHRHLRQQQRPLVCGEFAVVAVGQHRHLPPQMGRLRESPAVKVHRRQVLQCRNTVGSVGVVVHQPLHGPQPTGTDGLVEQALGLGVVKRAVESQRLLVQLPHQLAGADSQGDVSPAVLGGDEPAPLLGDEGLEEFDRLFVLLGVDHLLGLLEKAGEFVVGVDQNGRLVLGTCHLLCTQC
ncbi:MAG: hypothetical protein ACLFV7_03555 [Phycisphaerae bacterium]